MQSPIIKIYFSALKNLPTTLAHQACSSQDGLSQLFCLSTVLSVNCFVVRGCAVSRRYINVCNSDVFSVVTMYLDHLKFCVVCINGRMYVCCS